MPFKSILAQVVVPELNVCSAIVADWEGEAVDWLSSGRCDDDVRLFGAHLGIVLNNLVRAVDCGNGGAVREVVIRVGGADWFVFPVTSEYYLAVAALNSGQRARICHVAQRCVQQLLIEIEG